jgi:nucleoside-diphosphate-sugar epimerase
MRRRAIRLSEYNLGMRVFLAGATGVLGRRLLPLLVEKGHEVHGLTRSTDKAALVEELGGIPVVCDAFDRAGIVEAVTRIAPDVILHELTDLPDSAADLPARRAANARIRIEGTANLIAAARAAGRPALLAQSVAWTMSDEVGARGVATLEAGILEYGGVVLRYGQFYGPGTYWETEIPAEPRVHLDRAADLTVAALGAPSGIITLTD